MHNITHPTNDPLLVSYHRPELLELGPSLELALDCWNLLDTGGRGNAKGKYLRRELAEPAAIYKERLHRSTYTPIYRDSIRSYAGLLNRFNLNEPPASLDANQQNVDLIGSSVQMFWNRCDERALRDGGVYVMVDMPAGDEGNFFDQQNDGRVPYWIQIDRKDVINWTVEYSNGREIVHHATVRQLRSVPEPKGFGTKIEPIYYVLKPGTVEKYRMDKKDGKWYQVLEGSAQTSLPIVPLVWYGATSNRFAQGDMPMNGLAELSIQHFQMRSDLQELIHKLSMPVAVRKGAQMGSDGRPEPFVAGPNTAISLRASQVASQVAALIRNKVSSFANAMRLWAAYSGELASLTMQSGISINDSLINRPLDPSGIAQLVNLFNSGLLARETVLHELQRGGVLDPDLDAIKEAEKASAELPTVEDVNSEPATENPLANQ
ncbi:MAG: hypothetical protein P8Y72_01955 [Anaerolineales bacterium]